MPKKLVTLFFIPVFLACPSYLFSQIRSFSELFPACTIEQRNAAFSSKGYLYYGNRTENLTLLLQSEENTRVSKSSLGQNTGFFVEAMQVLYKNTDLLKIYNALGKIKDLKGRTYNSANGKKNILFTDASRIEGPEKQKVLLPDPPPALSIPFRETFFARLTDIRFGNCFFTVSLSTSRHGILYKITNFRTISYGPFPVMKENTFTALLYVEPVKEGLAVYCLAGTEVSDFIAKFVDIPSALNKRLEVFTGWMLDGLQ